MPLDAEKILCAVRVLDSGGLPLGTGFFVSVQSDALDIRYGYLVTAHHVVEDDPEVYVQATDPYAFREGRSELYPAVPLKGWRKPLDKTDLVIAPAPWRTDQAWACVRLEVDLLPTETIPRPWHPHLAGPVYYLGLFAPLDRLIARSGTIAALDQTGIPLGTERADGSHPYEYPVHLVDCRSYEGFSGSPCFTTISLPGLTAVGAPVPEDPPPSPKLPPTGRMAYLSLCCGMFTEHYDQRHPNRAVSRLGVGFMLRSDEIKAALMTDEAIKERREWDEANLEIRRRVAGEAEDKPTPASVPRDPGGQFDNFDALATGLVQVPKSEIDEQRKQEEGS